ncbi:MAG TPA: phenylalanine--tRNA ligase subunit beta [Candidatus Limnocylindrales bacterium]|nr:phenylalanine--tRNA ligase subunit beta [Candidatus Limnocylindrales bacterium]
MRVSYNWLRDYIEPGLSPDELAERFTLSGIEVGAVQKFGCSLPGVVVGQVLSVEPHPGRSNLTLVASDVGTTVLNIVCGAKNMKAGDKVAVALPGAELPAIGVIRETKIYGAMSSGMLCSAKELGLDLGSAEHILILDDTAVLGAPVEQSLELDDQILHLELTPNRADCLGMLGVAYEVAALTGGKVTMPPLFPPETTENIHGAIRICVQDNDLCPRYTARIVRDVTIKQSPLWMQIKLLKAGIRPINNVVDITNYVMWEFGQPLHAFDLDLLNKDEIIVRRARKDERLVTLDGVERVLDSDVLVIADSLAPIGLAGVMGGENTEISSKTRHVLIEAAGFDPINIRRTARRYNLPSEASQRFEKGVNPEAVLASQNRAALLMAELVGGKVLQGVIDHHTSPTKPPLIMVRPERVNKILGTEIPAETITAILEKLSFVVQPGGTGSLEVTVPLRRADVMMEEDIVEEIARLYGYDKIPVKLPRGELLANRPSLEDRLYGSIREILVSCGYFECITYSFINPGSLARLRLPDDDHRMKTISVQNPFTEEQAIMRTTLLPGLLKVLQHNYSYRELNQMFFEIGAVYEPESLPLEKPPLEKMKLAFATTGLVPEPNWLVPSRNADYFTMKGALEVLLGRLQIKSAAFIPAAIPFAHPTRCAYVKINGEELGFLGQLHPEVAEIWGINQTVTIGEVDLSILARHTDLVPTVTSLPRYPAASRDIAVVVARDILASQLECTIREAGGSIVNQVILFDQYEGKQVPDGKRSLAFSIKYRCEEGTLTEMEINDAQKNIEKVLFELGAVLRT